MLRALIQNGVLIGGVAVGITATGKLAPGLEAPSGALGASILGAESVGAAAAAVVGSYLVAAVIGAIVGRLCNTAVGLFAAGASLFGVAWRSGTVADVTVAPGTLAVETLLHAILASGVVLAVFRIAGAFKDVERKEFGEVPHPFFSGDALRSAAAGVLMVPAVWFLAQSTMKGQMIGVAFTGALAAGLAARLLAPHVQPILVFVAPIAFGAAAQVVGAILLRGTLEEAFHLHRVPTLLRAMPLDYACGALMGVAMGLGWAKSFLHHEDADAHGAADGPRRESRAAT
jgi:hypothetical protein